MDTVTLFLSGDVMTGRGIDQVLPHPSDPALYEPYVTSAMGYVELAEKAHGQIAHPVAFPYVWGEALEELRSRAPDLRIVNLETSVTTHDRPEPKGINYRMHPDNVPVLTAAGIDCCTLANNHVRDWGIPGLEETLATLRAAGIAVAGAGMNDEEAARPAVLRDGRGRRILVFALGAPSSGVPADWAAAEDRPGVRVLTQLSSDAAGALAETISAHRSPGDVVVVSLHWGGNWGYEIPGNHRRFARALIDSGVVDVVHGHSSHHPKGIEVYRGRPILYGCGDFINDYEGISGYEEYRSDLVLGYLTTFDAGSGALTSLVMLPFRTWRFRLNRATRSETEWLARRLGREGRDLGTEVHIAQDGSLTLGW